MGHRGIFWKIRRSNKISYDSERNPPKVHGCMEEFNETLMSGSG
jgi:hypothetical protein